MSTTTCQPPLKCQPVDLFWMASGLPVIVSDRAGAADLVVNGHNGYVVPAGQSGPIAERVAHLYHNPALVRRMGEAARRAAANLTLERFRRSYVSRLRALADGEPVNQ